MMPEGLVCSTSDCISLLYASTTALRLAEVLGGVLEVVGHPALLAAAAATASEAAHGVLDVVADATTATAASLATAEGLGALLGEVLKVLLVRHLISARSTDAKLTVVVVTDRLQLG